MIIERWLRLYYPYWKNRLTVLAYHRIVSDEEFSSQGLKIAISTSVSEFERQMCFVKTHFSMITIDMLQQWLQGNYQLPQRPALVTFDDGYQDIYTLVLPVLEKLQIPSTVFLATDYMGSSRMFQWDIASYCFDHTVLQSAHLPLLGYCSWDTREQRNQILKTWLAVLKKRTDDERQALIQQLADSLQVILPPENKGSTAFLTWEQIRILLGKGVLFGSHTCQHPILSKISYQRLEEELVLSKHKIEKETGLKVTSFAYPNGLKEDFNDQAINLLKQVGYQTAFTLLPGPSLLNNIKNDPLQISRITVTAKDNWIRFVLKLMGIVRLKKIFEIK